MKFSITLTLLTLVAPAALPAAVEYNRDIRPILADHCFNCHGADVKARKGKLRLDTRDGATAKREGNAAIVPGKPEASELVRRIFATAPDDRMPPPEHPLQLSDAQKQILRQWVAEGAGYQGHWAFIRPLRPAGPKVENDKWARTEIDRFILRRLAKSGLKPNAEASREKLIRRLSLDLTGLPPTPGEVDAFVRDESLNAREKIVDRLLESNRFGERMAMWWLDGARYADSHGFQADWERYQWPWRDWVINAFNRNIPFDQFTVEQLAGDLLPNATRDQIVATGFNRNHRVNTEGGSIDAEWLVENVIDRVETVGSVWLGLTLGCARCHDHKYDPVSQKEFYQLFAFFNNVPEQGKGPGKQGNFDPVLRVPSAIDEAKLKELAKAVADAEQQLKLVEMDLDKRIASWESRALEDLQKNAKGNPWQVLSDAIVESEGGATFEKLEDDSFLPSGKNPGKDAYMFSAKLNEGTLNALLLDVIPDPSMKNKSVGRASNGNFVLTDVEVQVIYEGADSPKPVEISRAEASHEQTGWPIAATIDDKPDTGWAVDGNTRPVQQQAIFHLAEPLSVPVGTTVVIRFSFESRYGQHAFGRFRMSSTGKAGVTLKQDEKANAEFTSSLQTPARKRNQKQKDLVRAKFLTVEAPEVLQAEKAFEKSRQALEVYRKKIPTVMVMKEMEKPRATYVLNRGQYDQRGDEVGPGLPAAFPPMPEGAPMNRLGLARWIASAENPLTARVQANRFWELLFGTGLVKTSENFGTQADWPSHPELLDWLATEFVRLKWDSKALLKTMLMSATYRQAATVTPDKLRLDPQNLLLSRGPRFRIQAEMVRDQSLYFAGLLVQQIGGPSVRPYQPAGIWNEFNFYGNLRNYKNDTDSGLYRRSLYTIWKRTAAPPGMTLFDMPSREICTVKRPRTNTPLQALALMNDVTFVEASRRFAERLLKEGGESLDLQISHGFRIVTSRPPSKDELATLVKGFERRAERFGKEPEAARQLIGQGESKPDGGLDPVRLAAMTTTASVLLNLDEALNK